MSFSLHDGRKDNKARFKKTKSILDPE